MSRTITIFVEERVDGKHYHSARMLIDLEMENSHKRPGEILEGYYYKCVQEISARKEVIQSTENKLLESFQQIDIPENK